MVTKTQEKCLIRISKGIFKSLEHSSAICPPTRYIKSRKRKDFRINY